MTGVRVAASIPILLMVLAGCDPGGPEEPQGARVELALPGLDGVETSGSVRIAVAWTYRRQRGYGLFTTDDRPLDLDATVVETSVSLPPPERRENVAPVERLFLGYANNQPMSTAAYRPRFVVYEDLDENGRFDPDVLDRHGPDRVLGLEDEPASIAYIIDVESVFSEIPFSRVESFYAATDGRFTSFVTVVDSGNMLELSVWDPQIRIVIDDSDFLRSSLECMRPTVVTSSTRKVRLYGDVDPSICGLEVADCRSVELDKKSSPQLPDPEDHDSDFVAQCRRRGDLEALVIGRRTTGCEDCSCSEDYEETVHIAARSGLPEWWPCGDQLEVCTDEDEDAFASYSSTCAEEQRERALEVENDR